MSRRVVEFDAAYYRRFYQDPKTRVYDQRRHTSLVSGVVHLIDWLAAPVESVLDVGAGVGWWRDWFRKNRPEVHYVSTEMNAEICRKYGHLQADITQWRSFESFNLVICQGVLPYLTKPQIRKAIKNMAAMCGGFLYLEAITDEDIAGSVDQTKTDIGVHGHSKEFYRGELNKYFREVGAGLFASRSSDLVLFGLEVRPDEKKRKSTRRA